MNMNQIGSAELEKFSFESLNRIEHIERLEEINARINITTYKEGALGQSGTGYAMRTTLLYLAGKPWHMAQII